MELPGTLVDRDHARRLQEIVASMCGLGHTSFPGSQPVSFKTSDISQLLHEDYWVCEKSDGIRVLLFILPFPNGQETYIIDRKNDYRLISGLYFPHYENKQRPLGHSLLDGELLIDTDPTTRKETMRYLAFDCIVCDGTNIMPKRLQSRYGRLKMHILDPYSRMLQELPDMAAAAPFEIRLKKMELAYYVEKVVREDMPKLHHESDGLVYTPAESGYVPGTDPKLLKWKAPSENTIDFKLELRFPAIHGRLHEPDYSAKPAFLLQAFYGQDSQRGGERYEHYDMMYIPNDEWETMKASGLQYDDRIVEVAWDMNSENWRFMRFRDDKTNGNYVSVVQNIVDSIKDGVEVDELFASAAAVKTTWKARETSHKELSHQSHPSSAPATATYVSLKHGSHNGATTRPLTAHSNPNYGEDDIRSSALYSRVSGPLSVNGVMR